MPPKPSDFKLDDAFGFAVNQTAFLMTEEIAKRFAALGYPLVAQDFGLLYRLEERGSLTQAEVGAMLQRDKTTVTRRIDGLVKKGMVERSMDTKDRRCFHIALTPEGVKALKSMKPLVKGFQTEALNDIPESEKRIALKVLKSVTQKLTRNKSQEA